MVRQPKTTKKNGTRSSNGRGGRASAPKIETIENRLKAVQLRLRGLSYDEIAKTMGLSNRSVAWKLVTAAIEDTLQETREDVSEYVATQVLQIDRLIRAVFPMATGSPPDLKAVDRMVKLMDRKARLLGLDAGTRALLGTDGQDEVDGRDAVARLLAVLSQGDAS